MKYYRLMENLPDRSPLGYGAAGARWNLKGIPLIYACNHLALNYLELLSIKGPSVAKSIWSLITIEVSGEIPHLDPSSLPIDWRMRPYPGSTQQIGSQWAQNKKSVYLKVPSCRIPLVGYSEEHNLLINPLHPDVNNLIKLVGSESVLYEINSF
ncbi:MAG: RES family NAD+ phosphorylase [Bacteroidota bacterium]|nr:RES family NAD+ phosphorylase [Bacteroidota bacterium]